MNFTPKRGDVVAYGIYMYFFEPDVNYGNLYHNSEEVGVHSKVAIHVPRRHIHPPNENAKQIFIASDKARRDAKPKIIPPRFYWTDSDESDDSREDV